MPEPDNGHPGAAVPASEQDARSRERLLLAAVDVFDRKGYAAASVREIVERAGMTKPALYYHFGSKEGILVAILQEGSRRFGEAVTSAANCPGTSRDRLGALCEAVYALFREHVPVARVAHAVYFGPREMVPAFDLCQFEQALDGALRRIIEDGIAAGELRRLPVEDVSAAIKGVIEVSTDGELDAMVKPIGSEGLQRLLDLIFTGLSATREDKEN